MCVSHVFKGLERKTLQFVCVCRLAPVLRAETRNAAICVWIARGGVPHDSQKVTIFTPRSCLQSAWVLRRVLWGPGPPGPGEPKRPQRGSEGAPGARQTGFYKEALGLFTVHFRILSELRPDSPDPWFWHRGWLWTRWASGFCDANGSEEPLGPVGSPPKCQ